MPDHERIMDRFIPSHASNRTYRARSLIEGLRDESILNLSQTGSNEGQCVLEAANASITHTSPLDAIATALEMIPQNRILSFSAASPSRMSPRRYTGGHISPSTPSSRSSHQQDNPIFSIITSEESPISTRTSIDSSFTSNLSSTSRHSPKAATHYRVLDAPSLMNDFYTNFVSWSTETNKIAVGLAANVYLWSEKEGVCSLGINETDLVSCVSFSGDFLVIATKSGRLSLFAQSSNEFLDHCLLETNAGVCCLTWLSDSSSRFFVGDEAGFVSLYEIIDSKCLKLVTSFKCHNQQVCGIAVNSDSNQIAVGGNDNCCTIWNIENIEEPIVKFVLHHSAAVKAISYCPWSQSLLATGGGSKDRHIRFWHTKSGTLIDSVLTSGQVTSLIWSKSKKQIVATFGYGDDVNPLLIALYSYPRMETLVQVNAAPNLRVLSAVLSPDSGSICVAANDETVRFYKLWNPKDSFIVQSQGDGVYGSDLIELCEGIMKHGGSLR